MSQKVATLIIENEVVCTFEGLDKEHLNLFVQAYSLYAKDYFFNPLYKLKTWDGKIRYFSWKGQTYNTLIPEIVPAIKKLGYKIKVSDQRTSTFFNPEPITEDIFSHIIHPRSGQPIILRDYQVNFTNTLMKDGSGIGIAATSAGKAQPLNSKILTPSGWIRMGEVQEGTEVITPHGATTTVTGVYPQGTKPIKRILLEDGSTVECCTEHLWVVDELHNGQVQHHDLVLSLAEIMERKAAMPDVVDFQIQPIALHDGNQTISSPSELGRQVADQLPSLTPSLLNELREVYRGKLLDRAVFVQSLTAVTDEFYVDTVEVKDALVEALQSVGFIVEVTRTTDGDFHITTRPSAPRKIAGVFDAGDRPAQCIAVEHYSKQYVTDNFIATHNTFICGALVESYRRVNATSIIIVPSTDLVKQTRTELATLGIETGEYTGKVKDTNGKSIIVSTWQSLKNNPTVLTDRDVFIVDETHGARGNVLQELLIKHGKNISHRFGVTGTLPEHPSDELTVRCAVGNVKATISASELIDRGVLATLQIYIMQLVEDLTPQYQSYCETYEDTGADLVSYSEFKKGYFPDYTSEKNFLASNVNRLNWISASIETFSMTGNVLVLVQGIKMGKTLASLIPGSRFVYSKDDNAVRDETYKLFAENDNIVVIATYGIASTGISIDRIYELVLLDVGKSFVRVMQSIGRGLRTSADKDQINVRDICSDLTYSKKHLSKRKSMYKTANYPFKVTKVDYNKLVAKEDDLI